MNRILYFFVFTITFFSYSQENPVDFYFNNKEKVREYLTQNNDSAKIIIDKLMNSADINYKSFAYVLKAYECYNHYDLEKLKKNLHTSSKLLRNRKDETAKRISMYAFHLQGNAYNKANEKDREFYSYTEAEKLASSIKDYRMKAVMINNLCMFYNDMGNTKKAIELGYQNVHFYDKYDKKYKCTDRSKARFYSNFGGFYNQLYFKLKKENYLDSAYLYFKRAIQYDIKQEIPDLRINIGNYFILKEKYDEAKTYFLNCEQIAIKNNDLGNLSVAHINLAKLQFKIQNYKDAIVNCRKIDSIYKLNKFDNTEVYINSNFLQSEIYKKLGDITKQKFHDKIYAEITKNYDLKDIEDTERINMILMLSEKEKEYQKQIKQSEKSLFSRKTFFFILMTIIAIALMYYLYRKYGVNSQKLSNDNSFSVSKNFKTYLKKSNEILLDTEQENRILNKIRELEKEKFFLNVDFNQKELAKKINTNTTYLSYVFNKNFNQNFNTYYNDQKINYAIGQINTDKKFREYSTLAIAESVGFKNADSFSSSFKKKTGKTPFQYISDLKNDNL